LKNFARLSIETFISFQGGYGGIIQSRGVKVKGLTVLVILAILLAGLILFGLGDTRISVADTGTSNNEVNSSMSKPIKKRDFWTEIRARNRRKVKATLKGYFD
jgi:hypothetical protein